MPDSADLDRAALLDELRAVRRLGPLRLREAALPRLAALAEPPGDVEELLRRAVARLEQGSLRDAAEYTLGLAPGTSDWPAAERRKYAAQVYSVSVERFRRHQELLVLGRLADQLTQAADPPEPSWQTVSAHRLLRVPHQGRTVRVHLHAHPVDLLRDVDVVVSPSNVYLALAEAYKSSVSAALRRAGALRGPTGDVLEDRLSVELRRWLDEHGAAGRPVPPGTVAPTTAGALERQGIRRIYHAAVAVPRAGTNDYDVHPADITRCAARALALLTEEHDAHRPPLRSICFPLLGAGRGGLASELSLRALWAALEAELSRGATWDLHLLVHHPAQIRTVIRALDAN
ncbi:macro domain-containing protein [Kitasatospora kifunensis]|uniref:O-acetyl-ADP-ribose deacetylase (Regulator of RNase III) n=1 Tax=Kitasatospora kifunensis TaxID=58351 RepID=A0A7W7VYC9_KITKI|nr:macro domain-containing protein [Kitasatospora kifunensis]MBB4927552.1 O-acetyl-ADP-ribose deacetylase (regulator of RNase III) [Kitasatospora kifunensis]